MEIKWYYGLLYRNVMHLREGGFSKIDNTGEEVRLMGKFEIYKDVSGRFRFRLKAPNGEIISTSEAYTTKDACKNGIAAVKKYAPNATVADLT